MWVWASESEIQLTQVEGPPCHVIQPLWPWSGRGGELVGGFSPPRPEKYDFVNGDDEIPNIWENKNWQPNHQPDIYLRHQPVKRIE